jgi:hypothetical protein
MAMCAKSRAHYAPKVRYVQAGALLLGAVMYVVVMNTVEQLSTASNVQWYLVIAGGWNLLLLVVTVIVIVDSIRKVRAKKTRTLATDSFVVKLASIPFFVLNYVVLVVLFVGGAAIFLFGGMVLWVAVAIGSGLTYLAMLSTSIYVWAAIAQLRRERIIGTGLTILYAILSLIFVTDIAAGIMLFGHSRRRPRLALVVVLLSTGLAMITLGLLFMLGIVGFVSEPKYDPYMSVWISFVVAGIVVVLATAIVSVVKRSTLKLEAQRAALARTTQSATSVQVLAD